MYLSKLKLVNFKRFSSVEFDFSPKLVVLLGPNSSGKSSILKAILALKQTASSSNENQVLAAQGDYVDLGVYKDYVHRHDIRKKISIAFSLASFPSENKPISIRNDLGVQIHLGHDHVTEQARLFGINFYFHDNSFDNPILHISKKKTRDTFTAKFSEEYATLYSKNYKQEDPQLIKAWSGKGVSAIMDNGYKVSVDHHIEGVNFSFNHAPIYHANTVINEIFKSLNEDLYYIGPLRRSPSRSYARTGQLLSVGPAGEHTPSVLANLKARVAKERSHQKPNQVRLDELNEWISSLFPGKSIDVRTVEELVKLIVGNGQFWEDTISDVGFGVSQVLPILVQIAVMPNGSTLLLEQPELHLHPSVQTRFAAVIAAASEAGRRFIIETHSEHFVRGIQLAISAGNLARLSKNSRSKKRADKALRAADVCFLYVPEEPANPHQMLVDEDGSFLEEWPSGFFDEAYKLASQLLENKIRSSSLSEED